MSVSRAKRECVFVTRHAHHSGLPTLTPLVLLGLPSRFRLDRVPADSLASESPPAVSASFGDFKLATCGKISPCESCL
jgi:hypothetical protein